MRILRVFVLPLLLLALSALAQQQPPRLQANQHQGKAPKSATHNGHPAIAYEGIQGWAAYVEYFVWQGEPALGFSMAEPGCPGRVYVTRTRINGDFQGAPSCAGFDLPRDKSKAEKQEGTITLTSGPSTFTLVPLVERDNDKRAAPRMGAAAEMLVRSVKAFANVYANVRRMGAEAQAQAATQNAQSAAQNMQPAASTSAAPRVQTATLNITSDPGDVQVYLNDEPRGMTSAEGHEVLHLPAGAYRLRLSMPGYKDFEQQVTLTAGKPQDLAAKMEPVGPPPFQASEVAEMLQGKMSPKRITTLVQERGVDFELNPDLEKRLRGLGATSDLLLAIATNKKK